jgi:acyl-CoA thioesterase I
MNPIALFFANGNAFLAGCAMIVLACGGALCRAGPRAGIVWRIALVVGVIFIAVTSTPLPTYFHVLWGLSVLAAWLRIGRPQGARRVLWITPAAAVLMTAWALAWELPHYSMPTVPHALDGRLIVIGDSITAGVNDGSRTWPALLRTDHGANVLDLSQPGMFLERAVSLARAIPPDQAGSAAVLEIGGNDVFAGTTAEEFERDLDKLLALARARARVVVLLELPLPPFRNRIAAAQRRLAAKHGAVLVPKRLYTTVIGTSGATIDGLHLSQHGHQVMAAAMLRILGG